MAVQHLSAQIVGSGRSAVAMAAYRHRTRMFDEATGEFTKLYDKERDDLVHAELALPDDAPEWASKMVSGMFVERASQKLWSYVQAEETRLNGQLAREIQIALPMELSREENIALVQSFIREHITTKGLIADWVYHDKEGNPHVHIMHTLKPVAENGFGRKASPVVGDDGMPLRVNGKIIYKTVIGGKEEFKSMRLGWGQMASEALALSGHDVSIDMRSYEARDIDLPSLDVSMAARDMALSGRKSDEWLAKERARFAAADRLADDPSAVIKLVSGQQSTFTEQDLAKAVHRYVDDPIQFQSVMAKVLSHPDISALRGRIIDPASGSVLTEPVYATKEMIRTEYDMGVAADRLAAAKGHGLRRDIVNAAIRAVETKDNSRPFSFDQEQVDAVHHVTRDNGIAAVAGFAGAGKSTLLEAANKAWVEQGRRVFGAALAGKAAEGLAESAGITSRTLASWELSWKNGRDLLQAGDVFVIDEAGMVDSGQLARFVTAIEAAGAKLVLVGDAMQLQPIEAGAAFRSIATQVGYLELAGIRRQKEKWAQDASRAFARGNVAAALQAYRDRGHIHSEANKAEVVARMVADWTAARAEITAKAATEGRKVRGGVPTAGSELLVLAHANADVLALNTGIRSALRESGALAGERDFVTARGTRQFAVEDRIVFLQNKAFTDPVALELGKQRVKNGMLGTVIGIERNAGSDLLRIRLDNGREVAFSAATYNNIDHGYAATVHKSQGVTVDRTFVLASGGMDQHLTYVAMSRHRYQVDLYVPASEFSPALTRGKSVEVQVNHAQGVTGTLVEAGSAPFRDDSDAGPTPYADIKTEDGKVQRLWGVAIPAALEKAGVATGDTITLKRDGTQTVIQTVWVTDEQTGAKSQQRREVQRNVWQATLVETSQDAESRMARGEALAVNAAANSETPAPTISSGVFDALAASLSRSGAKTTTLDYADSADYRQIVDGFAARRGIDTFASLFPALTATIEKHRQNLLASFERVTSLWTRDADATALAQNKATGVSIDPGDGTSTPVQPIDVAAGGDIKVSPVVSPSGALLPLTRFAKSLEEATLARIEQSNAWGSKLDAMQPLINRIYVDTASARVILSHAASSGVDDPRALAQIVAKEPERFGDIRHGNPAAVQAQARDLATHVRALGVSANQTRDKALASEIRHREAAAHAIPELSEKTMRRLAEIEAIRVAGGDGAWSQAARYTMKDAEVIAEVKALDSALTARFGWQAFSGKEDDRSRASTETRISKADRILLAAPAITILVTENTIDGVNGPSPAKDRAGTLTLEETWRAARQVASFNHFIEKREATRAEQLTPTLEAAKLPLPTPPAAVPLPPDIKADIKAKVALGAPSVSPIADQPSAPTVRKEHVMPDPARTDPPVSDSRPAVQEHLAPAPAAPARAAAREPIQPPTRDELVPAVDNTGPLVPADILPDLDPQVIEARVRQDKHIIDMGHRIDRSAETVYGDASVIPPLKRQAEQSSRQAEKLKEAIKSDPEHIAPLAGTPARFMRKASPERIAAQRNVNKLAFNVEKYGKDFNHFTDQIREEHRREQQRLQIAVPAPSPRLAEMLNMKPEDQVAAIRKTPELKTELFQVAEAMRQRLTPAEKTLRRNGETAALAKSLKIDDQAAKRLATTYRQVDQAENVVRRQRSLEQSKGIGRTI